MAIITEELTELVNGRIGIELSAVHRVIAMEQEKNPNFNAVTPAYVINVAMETALELLRKLKGKHDAEAFHVIDMMRRVLIGEPITVLLGDENEWAEENPEVLKQIGKELWFTTEHVPGTCIYVESMQYNIRYPFIKRFNNDNGTAHRTNAIRYINARTGESMNPADAQASPIRFITFPYSVNDAPVFVVDPEMLTVVNVIGNADNDAIGTPLPSFASAAIMADAAEHPEDYADDDDDDEDDIDEEEEAAMASAEDRASDDEIECAHKGIIDLSDFQ